MERIAIRVSRIYELNSDSTKSALKAAKKIFTTELSALTSSSDDFEFQVINIKPLHEDKKEERVE